MPDGHELAEGSVGPSSRKQNKVPPQCASDLRVEKKRNSQRATAIRSTIIEGFLKAGIEVDGEEISLLQLMRLDSMIDDGTRLVENARLARCVKPMEVVGFGALEELAALPAFAFATELRIEQTDPRDHPAVKGHVASERVTALPIHLKRFVSEILITEESRDFRPGNDPAR